jgi:hypothetical protein
MTRGQEGGRQDTKGKIQKATQSHQRDVRTAYLLRVEFPRATQYAVEESVEFFHIIGIHETVTEQAICLRFWVNSGLIMGKSWVSHGFIMLIMA